LRRYFAVFSNISIFGNGSGFGYFLGIAYFNSYLALTATPIIEIWPYTTTCDVIIGASNGIDIGIRVTGDVYGDRRI
jgi:hypothetical protein